MTTLYLIRHGETDWNADGRTMGQQDVPLNATGREQAAQTAAFLTRFPIDRILSSDLVRARDTAEAAGRACGIPVQTDPRLRELRFGIFEGRTIAECAEEHPEIVAEWRSGAFDFAPPGGETRRELMARAGSLLAGVLADPPGHLALFTHGGVLNALHTLMLESGHPQPREHIHRAFRFHNASLSMAAHGGTHWRFLVVNSTFHLTAEPRQLLH